MDSFLEKNLGYIIAVVVLFISLLTLFAVLGVDFNPHRHEHIDKIVTIESYTNGPLDENEEATIPSSSESNQIQSQPEVYQLKDDDEETGRSVSVAASQKDEERIDDKKSKERRIRSLLKNANTNFIKTLADSKGLSSHCHARFGEKDNAESHCNKIKRKGGCAINNCCVWLVQQNSPKCVAGSVGGPIYLTRNGERKNASTYYYQDKCYGEGC